MSDVGASITGMFIYVASIIGDVPYRDVFHRLCLNWVGLCKGCLL